MKRVVSVSLGSSSRNHAAEIMMLGERLRLERIGTDGDFNRTCELIRELDGKAAVIGLGGTDLYVVAGDRRYVIRESARLAQCAKQTPIVDGSGLKHTLERETIRRLGRDPELDLAHKKVLIVSAVDRFGMAEAFTELGSETIFGDVIFALGLPLPVRTMRGVRALARLVLPIFTRLPIKFLYPTGDAQNVITPKHGKYYAWADVIAGDFLFIKRHLPAPLVRAERFDAAYQGVAVERLSLQGKIVITNTVTKSDIELLRERGAAQLITTTPEIQGRSFGTNMMEAALIALSGKRPEEMTAENYLDLLKKLDWQPRVVRLRDRAE